MKHKALVLSISALRLALAVISFLFLLALALRADAQTKFSIFDQVGARGANLTPAKGQLFYTSDTNGTISPLPIGTANWCLIVGGGGTPEWSNMCVGALSSVGLSMPTQFHLENNPLTQNGTITITWNQQSANYVLAGPAAGSPDVPTFRAIQNADLSETDAGEPFGASGPGHHVGLVPDPGAVAGTTRFLREDATWSTTASGTVTSVGLSMPSQYSVQNSPVTDNGTLTVGWQNQAANYALLGPATGSATPPSFRAFDARDFGLTTKGDLLTRGTANTPARLGIGTDGYVLMADSNETTGLKWAAVSGVGTVTSVGLVASTGTSGIFSISGSPITGAGDITIGFQTSTDGKFLRSNGGVGSYSFAFIGVNDLPADSISSAGIVSQAPNDTSKFWRGDATWATPAGGGTVTSVGLSMPSWYSVANSPVTQSGTLQVTAASGQTANRFLATPNGSTGAIGLRAIASADLPQNTTAQAGAVPTAPNDSAKFWRGDASWAVPSFVSSVDFNAPNEISVSGVPGTGDVVIDIGWNAAAANTIFAGPASGANDTPTFRALVAADLPVFVGSGTGHAKGAVPDPGGTAGTTKFLREDASWQTPTFNSAIEIKEVDNSPDVTGVSILRFDQATGLSVTDNGSGTATVACSGCSGGGQTALRQDTFTGDGSTTQFTLGASPVTNGVAYVALNGLPQPGDVWTLSGSNVTMDTAPIDGAMLTVGYFTALPGSSTHTQEDFTGDGSTTDFSLAHTAATSGVLLVSLRGLVQPQTSWSLVSGGTVLRMAAAPKTGDAVTISYNY